jgi:TetR/AcrR family transcriptional repressor of nem operon
METELTETRQQIVARAAEIISRQGFHRSSVDEIIRAAEVCKGNFYYYFPSKTALGLAVIDAWADEFLELVVRPSLSTHAEPLERLEKFIDATVEAQRQNGYLGCPLGRLALEMGDLDEAFRERLEIVFDSWCSSLTEVLDEGGADRPADQARFIMATLEGALLLAKVQVGGEGLDCVAEQLKSVLRQQLPAAVLQ